MNCGRRILVAIEARPYADGLSHFLCETVPQLEVVKWCEDVHGDVTNPQQVLGALKAEQSDVLLYHSSNDQLESRLAGLLLSQLPKLLILFVTNDCVHSQQLARGSYANTLQGLLRALGHDIRRVIPAIEQN